MSTLLYGLGIRRIHTLQCFITLSQEIQARITFKVSFCETNLTVFTTIHPYRQESQTLLVHFLDFTNAIDVLKRTTKLRSEITILTSSNIGSNNHRIVVKVKAGIVFFHLKWHFTGGRETISNAIIISTELHRIIALECQCQSIVVFFQLLSTIHRRRYYLIYFLSFLRLQLRILSPYFTCCQGHTDRRIIHQLLAI